MSSEQHAQDLARAPPGLGRMLSRPRITAIACVVVVIELAVIAWVQWRFMETPPLSAVAKVMLGGALVLAAGILIGSS